MDLATAVLIKDNHLAALDGDVAMAVHARARARAGGREDRGRVRPPRAGASARSTRGADIILLDNMSLDDDARGGASSSRRRAILEASGGVTLTTVRAIAETGVDWISVGALTHSAPAMDLGLDFD